MNPHDATCPAPRKFRPAARIQWLLLLSIGLLSPLLHAADETPETPKGLAKSDWSSIRAAYEAGRHEIRATEGGHEARNPGLGWRTNWDGRGFLAQPASAGDGAWQWGLQLESYGFPGAEQKISQTAPAHAEGQRLTYQWDANVQEWYVNDQRGVEHGFTVAARPLERDGKDAKDKKDSAAAASLETLPSLLSFQLSVRGGLHPAISPDAQTVRFMDAAGAAVVTYGGLKVWDALPPNAATAVHEMRVEGDAPGAALEFSSWEQRVGELAWIVDAAAPDTVSEMADVVADWAAVPQRSHNPPSTCSLASTVMSVGHQFTAAAFLKARPCL